MALTKATHRMIEGASVNVKDYGAVGDGVTDDTAAIQAAFDTTQTVIIPAGTYKLTAMVTIKGDVIGEYGSLLKFYGTLITKFINRTVAGSITGISIDGTNVTDGQYGIFVDMEYEPENEVYSDITVTNITSTTVSTHGILIYRSSSSTTLGGNFTIDNCYVKGISGSSVSKGIAVAFNNESTTSLVINACTVKDVTPVADGDAIHIASDSFLTATLTDSDYGATISNCFVSSSVPMKRAIKIQYDNAKVVNNTVIGDNIGIGYDSYANNTLFDGNSYTETTSGYEAYNLHYKSGQSISNATIVMNSYGARVIRLYDATNAKLSNIDIEYKGTALSDAVGMIELQDDSSAIANNINIRADVVAGSGITIMGTSTLEISNSVIDGTKIGIRDNYSTGHCNANQVTLKNVTNGFQSFGDLGFTFNLSDSYVEASNIGIYSYSTGHRAQLVVDNCEIKAVAHGILGYQDDIIQNSSITNTGSPSGYGVSAKTGFKCSNNIITNFDTGIAYNYSTNTIVNNNVTIDCTTEVLKTGSTDFVYVDNFSR